MLAVLFHVLNAEGPGVEIDLLARTDDEVRPVSAIWDGPDALLIQVGASWSGAARDVGELGEFLSRWNLELERDQAVDWHGAELALLDQALALLSPRERARVEQLPFRRSAAGFTLPNGKPAAAAYRTDFVQGYRFEFYSVNTRADSGGFIGAPSRPHSRQLLTVLHELGHAIADHDRRLQVLPLLSPIRQLNASFGEGERADAALEPDPTDQAALTRRRDALARNLAAADALTALGLPPERLDELNAWLETPTPIELALAEQLGDAPPITEYAATSPSEGFAEFFAYAHLDPDAMRRVYPQVAEWLLSGRYLDTAQDDAAPWR